MNKAWEEVGNLINDGFRGVTYTANNDPNGELVLHIYNIGLEKWLTIKQSHGNEINTINIVGETLEEVYDFIGGFLNKK